MAKYDPLFRHLCRAPDGRVELTFDEIEQLVGPLPVAAARQHGWWANETLGNGHVQAKAWLNAGREVESVDRARRTVTFTAAGWRRGA